MRWFKVAAIGVGILIAFLIVGSVIGAILHAVINVVIAAAVVGAIVVAVKVARSRGGSSARRPTARSASPAMRSTAGRCRGPTSCPGHACPGRARSERPGHDVEDGWPG